VVLTASVHSAARLRVVRFLALVGIGSVAAHDIVAAIRTAVGDGIGAAGGAASMAGMTGMTDGAPVSTAMLDQTPWILLTLGAVLAAGFGIVFGCSGIAGLARAIRRLPSRPAGVPADLTTYRGELGRLWPRLFLALTAVFTIQENIEHAHSAHAMHGAAILVCPEHPAAIPVLIGISLLLAAIGAWFRWQTQALRALLQQRRLALRFARPVAAHAPARRWRVVAATVARQRLLACPQAGRAPPAPVGA